MYLRIIKLHYFTSFFLSVLNNISENLRKRYDQGKKFKLHTKIPQAVWQYLELQMNISVQKSYCYIRSHIGMHMQG